MFSIKIGDVLIAPDGKHAGIGKYALVLDVTENNGTYTAVGDPTPNAGAPDVGIDIETLKEVQFLPEDEYRKIAAAVKSSPSLIDNMHYFKVLEKTFKTQARYNIPKEIKPYLIWGGGSWDKFEPALPIQVCLILDDNRLLLSLDGKWIGDYTSKQAYSVHKDPNGYTFKPTNDNIPMSPASLADDKRNFLPLATYNDIVTAFKSRKQ